MILIPTMKKERRRASSRKRREIMEELKALQKTEAMRRAAEGRAEAIERIIDKGTMLFSHSEDIADLSDLPPTNDVDAYYRKPFLEQIKNIKAK